MEYKLDQSDKGWVDDAMKKRGTYVPPKTKTPTFCPSLMFIWDSFWTLSTCRNELGPIPWTAINDYCTRWGIVDPIDFDEFVYFITGIDGAFLKYKHGEIENKRKIQSAIKKK